MADVRPLRPFELTTPTIHSNGTGRAALQAGYEAAYRALTDALQALDATAPHGRDYYVQSPGALARATAEHTARLQALAQVRDQLLTLHDSCDEGAQQLKLQPAHDCDETCTYCPTCYRQDGREICGRLCPHAD